MLLAFIFMGVGFAALLAGAHWVTNGASSIAQRLKIPTLVVGLTIVAFGTSAPELLINIFANLSGEANIAVGDVLGSSIANVLLILGIAATIRPLTLQKSTIWKEIPISFFAIVALALLGSGVFMGDHMAGLSRIDGIILLLFFVFFLYYIFTIIRERKVPIPTVTQNYTLTRASILTMIGMICLAGGGYGVVNGAVTLATILGVSDSFIALTIVAVGTSLPELATSAIAAYKNRTDISIGNIVGSNIFNIFWVLGLSATIRPLPFSSELIVDIFVSMAAVLLLFIFMFIGKRVLNRWQGTVFILLYVIYIISLTFRHT